MKKIKLKKLLDDSILEQLKATCLRFYACDWNPNGTNDLIITDEGDCEILDIIPEALFGVRVNKSGFDDEFVTHAYHNHITLEKEFDPDCMTMITEISPETLLDSIAVSPTQKELDVIYKILKVKE